MSKKTDKIIEKFISRLPSYYCFAFKCSNCESDEYGWPDCDRLKVAGHGFITCYKKSIKHDCDCPYFIEKN